MTPECKVTSRPRGFTLIELLVVVGIVILLAALIFPAVAKFREGAGMAKCVSNLRQIGQGFRGYINENQGYAPPQYGVPFFDTGFSPSTLLWTGHLAPYMGVSGDLLKEKLPRVFDCPQDPDAKKRSPNRGLTSTVENWGMSYGYNYAYITSRNGWWRHENEGYPNLRVVSNMTTLVLAADSQALSKGGEYMTLIDATSFVQNPKRGVDFRHQKMFNAVFLDGHVQGLDATSLQEEKYWRPLH